MPEGASILITASYFTECELGDLKANAMAAAPPTFLMCGVWKEQRVTSGEKVY